eukprot:c12323_g1_i1 orf=181-525(+)
MEYLDTTVNGNEIVCITGARGSIASWLVKLLLQWGYHVRGTVKSVEDDRKNGHFKQLKGAKERLSLVKADLVNYGSLFHAINGSIGVFHTAYPIRNHSISSRRRKFFTQLWREL